jgi:DNA-binding HxlR family transcriptional regulator
MAKHFRCNCPVTSALDILGDRWILVIVKQMLIEHLETFKDFTASDEAITSNILTNKLKLLQEYNLVEKTQLPTNKKSVYYHLTNKGLALAPIIVELSLWSDSYMRKHNPHMQNPKALKLMKADKEEFAKTLINNYKEKRAATLA